MLEDVLETAEALAEKDINAFEKDKGIHYEVVDALADLEKKYNDDTGRTKLGLACVKAASILFGMHCGPPSDEVKKNMNDMFVAGAGTMLMLKHFGDIEEASKWN